MKLRTFIKLTILFPLLVGCNSKSKYLTSNDNGTATIRIYKTDATTDLKDRYISPKKVKLKYTYNSLSGTLSNNENVCPSIGDVNLLVIPVHIKGDDTYKTEAVRKDIETMFFSKNSSRMGYPSVSEYYYESSYGKLNFQGVVTDWYDTNLTSDLINQEVVQYDILRKAVAWAEKTQNINLKDFDKNEDGSIDAVWLVYDHLDWSTEFSLRYGNDSSYNPDDINATFWNYTGWDWDTLPGDKPTTSAFSWASFDMMYTPYAEYDNLDYYEVPNLENLSQIKLDSHTFIHETGHLLGLEDYYNSDDSTYHPAGKSTMMDQNICDLDSYSKMLLGWVTPYVVYGSSEILIPTATSSDHAVIVIPHNYEEISDLVEKAHASNKVDDFIYEFNPFSEYLMIDLYSPDGLNELDTYGPYIYGKEASMTNTGVRIYHVDSRIFKCRVVNYDGGSRLTYVEGYNWDGNFLANNEAILMPISNRRIESTNFQLPNEFDYFDQIRLLEANRINTFDNNHYASNNSLWTTNSEPFDITAFGYQFFNASYTYNNGEDMPFKVKVTTLKGVE